MKNREEGKEEQGRMNKDGRKENRDRNSDRHKKRKIKNENWKLTKE